MNDTGNTTRERNMDAAAGLPPGEAERTPAPGEAPDEPMNKMFVRRDKDALLRRLRRIEGQVRGLQRMVDEDKYCVDILVQIAAVRAALDRVGLMLLKDHTKGCVARAIERHEGDEAVDELMDVISKFIR